MFFLFYFSDVILIALVVAALSSKARRVLSDSYLCSLSTRRFAKAYDTSSSNLLCCARVIVVIW